MKRSEMIEIIKRLLGNTEANKLRYYFEGEKAYIEVSHYNANMILEEIEKAGMRPSYRSPNIMKATNYVIWEPEDDK